MTQPSRKEYPMYRGLMCYFPTALAEVAHVSKVGNDQHNPNSELHWDKSKSQDHADCLLRHLTQAGLLDTDGLRHTAKVAWRALAMLQIELEGKSKSKIVITYDPGHETEAQTAIEYITAHPDSTSVPLPAGVHLWKFEDGMPPSLDLNEHKPIKQFDTAYPKNAVSNRTVAYHGRRVYLAGPMRGIKDLNFSAFDAAKKKLQSQGYEVISPADLDREHGTSDARGYAKRDTAAILTCNAIYLLKGWETSAGASAEFMLARWIGLDIICETGDADPLHSFALKHGVP